MSNMDSFNNEFSMGSNEANSFGGGGGGNSYGGNQGNNQGGNSYGNNQGNNSQQPNQNAGGQSYQNNNSGGGGGYSNNNSGGGYNKGGGGNSQYKGNSGGGGYNKSGGGGYNKGGGGGGFQRKPDTPQPPYLPILVHIEDQFPDNIKEELIGIIERLIMAGYIVRYNADELPIHNRIQSISNTKTEALTPWKNFNDIDSKLYYNTVTANQIAEENNPGWERLSNLPKAKLARNVRSLFGNRNANNSRAMAVITWSPDGANNKDMVTRDTGYVGSLIRMADRYKFPIYNIGNGGNKQYVHDYFLKGE